MQNVKNLKIEHSRLLNKKRVEVNSSLKCNLLIKTPKKFNIHAKDLVAEGLEIIGKNEGKIKSSGKEFIAKISYEVKPKRVGIFKLGPTLLKIFDDFNLFYTFKKLDNEEEIIAFPSIYEIKKFDLASKRRVSEMLYGFRRSWYKGFGTEFFGLREYIQGDDPRNIDWKASSRLRKLFTKEFEAERKQRVIIALDCSKSMFTGEPITMLEKAIDTSLLLSHIALKRGDMLGFATFSDKLLNYLPPSTGKHQLSKILELIARIEIKGNPNLLNFFKELLALEKRRAFIILISNLELSHSNIISGLKLAISGKHKILVLYTFPPDFEIFKDETDKLIASAARQRYEEKLDLLRVSLARYGIMLIPVAPETIVPLAIKNYAMIMEHGIGAR